MRLEHVLVDEEARRLGVVDIRGEGHILRELEKSLDTDVLLG